MVYVTDIPGTTSFALSIAFSKSFLRICRRNQSQINPQFACIHNIWSISALNLPKCYCRFSRSGCVGTCSISLWNVCIISAIAAMASAPFHGVLACAVCPLHIHLVPSTPLMCHLNHSICRLCINNPVIFCLPILI